jgi:acetylornithine deacetylase/succinyl-diaminopimelate desuccinylase-like protein
MRTFIFALVACALLVPGSAVSSSAASSSPRQNHNAIISTKEEISADIALAPCKDAERMKTARALFVKMGARDDEMTVEKLDGVENLIIRKKGKSSGTIVIGAHYDKVEDGCGAIDNWTGIVAIAHIFKGFKDIPVEKTLLFVAFGKEEKGLLGSKAMVKAIKKEEEDDYCAMVNIDSLGMARLEILASVSSESLSKRAEEIAGRMKLSLDRITVNGTSDSSSFLAKKIPAITITGVASGWEKVLHSSNDQTSRVNPAGVYIGYRLALALVAELHNLPCDVSRK